MHEYYRTYKETLQDLHKEIEAAIQGLPDSALDWLPGEGMNSIAVLVVHLTGAERYWVGDVASGETSGRDREAEFRTKGLSLGALRSRLDETTEYVRRVLSQLSPEDLEQSCVVPHLGKKVARSFALNHAMVHTAMHLGHIQLTRQLWERRTNDVGDTNG